MRRWIGVVAVCGAAMLPGSTGFGLAAEANPPGASPEQVALGDKIFHGKAKDGTCSGCHGEDAKGTDSAPNLTSGPWLWADGSLPSIAKTVTTGVEHPKKFEAGMPPLGGADLNDADVQAVAGYVWSISRGKGG